MYVAELAPARRRGQLVLTFQVGIGVGIVVSTLVGASEALSWRLSIGLAAVPAMLMLMLRLPKALGGWSSATRTAPPPRCCAPSERPDRTSTRR